MRKSAELLDLDDGSLINIFGRLDPLPHLFDAAAVCKRFRSLAKDGRLWLRVGNDGEEYRTARGHRQIAYPTLHRAISSSRPGDTIIVAPGTRQLETQLKVDWPLKIIGAGPTAEANHIIGNLHSGSATFLFRASGILENISISSNRCSCIEHLYGKLRVESCSLQSRSTPGLEHLIAPIYTAASLAARMPTGNEYSLPENRSDQPDAARSERRLSVKQTKIQGPQGMRAIRTFGPGSLSNVRVIPLAAHTVFWFEVNAAKAVEQIQPIFIASLAGHVECTQPDMPAWALSSKPLFPQEALRRSKRPYLEEDSSQGSLNHLDCLEEAQRLSDRAKRWRERY